MIIGNKQIIQISEIMIAKEQLLIREYISKVFSLDSIPENMDEVALLTFVNQSAALYQIENISDLKLLCILYIQYGIDIATNPKYPGAEGILLENELGVVKLSRLHQYLNSVN